MSANPNKSNRPAPPRPEDIPASVIWGRRVLLVGVALLLLTFGWLYIFGEGVGESLRRLLFWSGVAGGFVLIAVGSGLSFWVLVGSRNKT
ncbi:MAG: hypothetical protein RLY93_08875 [Sumerlaeia bacterium]